MTSTSLPAPARADALPGTTRPGLPWLRRIEARIVALFLALLLAVQAVSFALVQFSLDTNAHASIESELGVARRVFDTVLAQRAENLTARTTLLAADYGLRSAIASGDEATIVSALQNHSERIGAQVAFLTGPDFVLRAATRPDADRFSRLLAPDRVPAGGDGHPIVILDGRPYFLVRAPVRAPVTIGWVAMAFPIDRELLQEAHKVLSLDAVLVRRSRGAWEALDATGVLEGQRAALAGQLPSLEPAGGASLPLKIGKAEYAGAPVRLATDGDHEIDVILVRSVTEALAKYERLRYTLLMLAIAGIAVFAAGSILTARRIANPIQALSASAGALEQGDYETPISTSGQDEVAGLALALEQMRHAVRSRQDSIVRLAYWDTLTELPNRVQFSNRLAAHIGAAAGEPGRCAVLILDLDRFKQVNDVLGQGFGDRVLCQVARRLEGVCLDDGDLLARLGGDEFAMLLADADGDAAMHRARRILAALESPFRVDDQTIDVGAGIGAALCPADGRSVHELLRRAEIAMYAAKRRGAGAMMYDGSLDSGGEASLSLLSQLRRAVVDGELCLYLQPKARVHDGRILGAEALVRWLHPQRGLVPPAGFIPFAEQTGFIRTITAWMLHSGVAWLGRADVARAGLRLSVNLSTRDLLDHDLAERIAGLLKRFGVDPSRLCLEITESKIMEDPQRSSATLQQLHAHGVKLSIDDFGTGYSSLAYLKQLNVDELKIDRSFVGSMERNPGDALIVRSTIELGHSLGLSVVAEGVETPGALRMLSQWRCDEAQGYLIGRPAPAADFDVAAALAAVAEPDPGSAPPASGQTSIA
jgi:diguanylate cyclase